MGQKWNGPVISPERKNGQFGGFHLSAWWDYAFSFGILTAVSSHVLFLYCLHSNWRRQIGLTSTRDKKLLAFVPLFSAIIDWHVNRVNSSYTKGGNRYLHICISYISEFDQSTYFKMESVSERSWSVILRVTVMIVKTVTVSF